MGNINSILYHFICIVLLTVDSYKAALQKYVYRFKFRSLMSKSQAPVARKNSPKQHKEETFSKGPQKEPILFWVTQNIAIMSHYSLTTLCYKVRQYLWVCWKDLQYEHQGLFYFYFIRVFIRVTNQTQACTQFPQRQ